MGITRIGDWEGHLGDQIRRARLLDDMTQKQLARRSNIGIVTLQNLEAGKGSSLATLVKVLRGLGRTEWLGTLEPRPEVSPLALARAQDAMREPRRASRRPRD